MYSESESALESRARRAARRVGFIAQKSRRYAPPDDHGMYRLLCASSGYTVCGDNFTMSAEDVVEHCRDKMRLF